jgi:hypothetical protein
VDSPEAGVRLDIVIIRSPVVPGTKLATRTFVGQQGYSNRIVWFQVNSSNIIQWSRKEIGGIWTHREGAC